MFLPLWAPSCCCPVSPAPETLGSAPGRAVPSSQARELGAVICLSVHGGGWMQFVKDPPQAGLVEPQEPLGHPPSPAWLSPKWQLRAAHTSEQGVGTPQLPPAPLQPLARLPPHRAGGAGRDHPTRHGVSSALPRVTRGLWVCRGGFGPTWGSPWNPSTVTAARGGSASVIVRGSTLCWGHRHTHMGGQCQGYSPGLTATPAWGATVPRSAPHPCRGTSARVTVTPALGEH